MLNTVEAVLQPNGALQFLEPVSISTPRRVLVTFTDRDDEAEGGAMLSQPALAVDWLDPIEDAAWAHLQPPSTP